MKDNFYGDWEDRLKREARPFTWRDALWIVAKGVLIGAVVVLVTRGF